MLMMLLTGCNETSGGSSSAGSASGSSSYSDSGKGGTLTKNNPEPVTTALVGSGLMAYAFLKRKKRK